MSMPLLSRTLAANVSAAPTDVHTIKTVLKMLGHYQAPDWGVDEFPDRALFDALRAFQKDQGLKVDGAMKPGGESEFALKAAAQMVRAQGRNGDTVLAHISPTEAALLDKVTDGGSINPATGLPEFFIGDMFGELGSSLTSLGDGLMKALPHLSEDYAAMGRRSTRQKAGGLVGDVLGALAKKSPSNPLGPRMSPSLGIGLETRSGKPANPARVQNEYVISENKNTDRTNTQRAAPTPAPAWGVPPVTPKLKPKIAPATPIFQNPDRLRQWVKDAQAQTRLQPQQRTVSPGVQLVPAEASASNAGTADALSKTMAMSGSRIQSGNKYKNPHVPYMPANKRDWFVAKGQVDNWTKFHNSLKARSQLGEKEQHVFQEIFGQEGGMTSHGNGATAGILQSTLDTLVKKGRVNGTQSNTSPKDLSLDQMLEAYIGVFDTTFYALDGSKTLNRIQDKQAAAVLGDSLFSHGTGYGTQAIQIGINAVQPGTFKNADGIPGSQTIEALNKLTSNPKTRDATLNAIADARWGYVKGSTKIPESEKKSWRDRINYFRPYDYGP